MREWQRFEDETVDFCKGKDFPWSKPNMTLSQFIHHWRRNSPCVIPRAALKFRVSTDRCKTADDVLWKGGATLNGLRATKKKYLRLRSYINMGKDEIFKREVEKAAKTDKCLAESIEKTQMLYPALNNAAKSNQTDLVSLQGLMRLAKSEARRNSIETVKSFTSKIDLDVTQVYNYMLSVVPDKCWITTEAHPIIAIHIEVELPSGYHTSMSPYYEYPMSFKPNRSMFNSYMMDYFGPRILPYNSGDIINQMEMHCFESQLDPYQRYVIPIRDITEDVTQCTFTRKNRVILADYERTVLSVLDNCNDKLTAKDRRYWAQNIRRAMAKLTGQQLDRMLYLFKDEWFYETYSYEEYKFLGAIGLLPKCKSVEQYHYEHQGVRALETIKILQEQKQEDELPF